MQSSHDAYKKIEYLGRIFNDSQAKDLKNIIDKNLKSGNYIREWDIIENYLYKKLELIDEMEYDKLSFIKQLRNIAAHLSLNEDKDWSTLNANEKNSISAIVNFGFGYRKEYDYLMSLYGNLTILDLNVKKNYELGKEAKKLGHKYSFIDIRKDLPWKLLECI